MPQLLTRLLKSPNFLTGLYVGLSGLAFAAANIILASVQTIDDYAIFALVVAVITLSSRIGLLGADGMVNRHDIAPDARMFYRVASTGLIAGIFTASIMFNYYDVGISIAFLLIIAVTMLAIIFFAAAYFQSRQDFQLSLILLNSFNFVLLAVALTAMANLWQGTLALLVLTTVLLVLVAIFCVVVVIHKYQSVVSGFEYDWREAVAYVSIVGSASVLVQLERLLTPQLLELKDLATLGVLLAIVGPPFRLLQMTLGYVLLPKLRAARGPTETKLMIKREVGVALAFLVPSWFFAWVLVPIIDSYFFGDKYQLSAMLIFSVIFAGTAKVLNGIARASVAALASAKEMEAIGISGWIGVALSIAGAYYGASFGLGGIVYGVSAGWIMRLIIAVMFVRKYVGAMPPVSSAKD